MRFFPAELLLILRGHTTKRNFFILLNFILILAILVGVYSVLFHIIMAYEGQEFSWITGIYWTLITMSTLGFGDITFASDLGRLFSILVLLSGLLWLLILLPVAFIEFFYEPWSKAQSASRVPRALPEKTRGHVILTHYDIVARTLIRKLEQYGYPYVLLIADLTQALHLHDLGIKVVLGDPSDPEAYQKIQIQKAALLATTSDDPFNAMVAITARQLNKDIPIISTVRDMASKDILKLAGASHVLDLGERMGYSLVRRTNVGDTLAHGIGRLDDLIIAEATPPGSLIGKTIIESGLTKNIGVAILGVWEKGRFYISSAETLISPHTMLVLAGFKDQLKKYNETFCKRKPNEAPVIIIGGGRVARAIARALDQRKVDYRIIEKLPKRIQDSEKYILGDAAELDVLKNAGIMSSPTVIITTHDAPVNIYLTVYLRGLSPDIQIISRAGFNKRVESLGAVNEEGNVEALHRAGADFVMSYASMGANVIFNLLKYSDILMVEEGLDLFKVKLPPLFRNKSISQMPVRKKTGCSIIAVKRDGKTQILPDPYEPIPAEAEIILIGSPDDENRFMKCYGQHLRIPRKLKKVSPLSNKPL